jgi:hypothetical protein
MMSGIFSFDDFNRQKSSIKESIKNKTETITNFQETNKFVENEKVILIDESDNNNYYKLYRDVNEDFSCLIAVEGSTSEKMYARLIVESDDLSLVFTGNIEDGKCIVPIKKIDGLKDGVIGNIKLEVIIEGNLFVPWEDTFKYFLTLK